MSGKVDFLHEVEAGGEAKLARVNLLEKEVIIGLSGCSLIIFL